MAYYGSYTVDADRSTVVHRLEQSLIPNWTGGDQARHLELQGTQLPLQTPPKLVGGAEWVSTLVWEKLSGAVSSASSNRHWCRFARWRRARRPEREEYEVLFEVHSYFDPLPLRKGWDATGAADRNFRRLWKEFNRLTIEEKNRYRIQ